MVIEMVADACLLMLAMQQGLCFFAAGEGAMP
jgi:hypothetical protein